MDARKEREIDDRLSRIESVIAALQQSVDSLTGARFGSAAQPGASRARATSKDDLGATISDWFSSRSPEWWLSRLGIGFVVIAVLFLYGYAVDKGWITPPLRVVFGAVVGGGLFYAATRIAADVKTQTGYGLRQVLYGGALAVWYLTAYAASVWYGLISIPSARLLFFLLTILSAWISLQERSELFAFIAIVTGFATPFVLLAPVTSLTPFAIYLGAVAAAGLFIYLLRGWQSTIWITFLAFWVLVNGTALSGGVIRAGAPGSIAVSLLLVVAGAAFTRVTSLRRQLLATGSNRYTPAPVSEASQRIMEGLDSLSKILGGGKSAPDSLALWVMTLLTPILAVASLANIWLRVPAEVSGLILVGIGSAALSFGMSKIADTEFQQVVLTGAALWSLLGILKIAPAPENTAIVAIYASLILIYVRKALIGARTIAKVTIAVALTVVAGHGLSFAQTGLIRWRWLIAEIVTVAASGVVSRKLIADKSEQLQGAVLAGLTYLTSLVVIMNVLDPIWPPLVTAAYAIFGAVLLIVSRRRGGERLLRQMG
ncbi:MAG TPA: DUF2339 domain-containing protein, partial [Gemmatimonadaceae bacterium]|nr:DUF2339 domain-containing protein [Gemmatimonadaceae bacterium]